MSEQDVQSLVSALPAAALVVQADGIVIGANEAAETLLGDHVRLRHYATVLRQPDLLAAIAEALEQGTPADVRYLSRNMAGDTTFRVSARWFNCGAVAGVLVVFEDTSPMEQADKMRRDFVANVSHELRTPLTALKGFVETLQGPARNDAQARERFLTIMADEADRMQRLVSDLMSLNRVETQQRQRPAGTLDICALTRSVLQAVAPVAQQAGVELQTDLPAEPLILPGDEDQIRQVMTNLVENAIKYGGSGGRVLVSLTRVERAQAMRGPAAVLAVRDFGQGIEVQHLSRLTERFYRVDTHRSRQVGGTGLGLAIVKHIVGRHRGRLKIESEPGQGSTFKVTLPVS